MTDSPTVGSSPVVSFSAVYELQGMVSATLDAASQLSIVEATATTLNVNVIYVTYVGSQPLTMLANAIMLMAYQVIVTTAVAVPTVLYPQYDNDPNLIYMTLKSTLQSSVTSGSFQQTLASAIASHGADLVTSSVSVNVTGSMVYYTTQSPSVASSSSSSSSVLSSSSSDSELLSQSTIIYIAAGGGVLLLIIIVSCMLRKNYCRRKANAGASFGVELHDVTPGAAADRDMIDIYTGSAHQNDYNANMRASFRETLPF
jgi:hypothetical protein